MRRGGQITCAFMLVWLAGCVNPVGLALNGKVSGDADQARVDGRFTATEGMAFAVAHCSSHGRSARYARREGGVLIYDCVPA